MSTVASAVAAGATRLREAGFTSADADLDAGVIARGANLGSVDDLLGAFEGGSGTAARLISDSAFTPARLCTFKIRPNPLCFCGAPVGDIEHALFRCRRPTLPRLAFPVSIATLDDATKRL